ncbi:glycosyl transferase family 90-domain-containing protein [Mycena haematopus]|nr:glycosyl transferase family 90-domain-containing protein [Mycena haematopus]
MSGIFEGRGREETGAAAALRGVMESGREGGSGRRRGTGGSARKRASKRAREEGKGESEKERKCCPNAGLGCTPDPRLLFLPLVVCGVTERGRGGGGMNTSSAASPGSVRPPPRRGSTFLRLPFTLPPLSSLSPSLPSPSRLSLARSPSPSPFSPPLRLSVHLLLLPPPPSPTLFTPLLPRVASKFGYLDNVPLDQKKLQLYWHGMSNGGMIISDNYHHFAHFKLVDIRRQHPHLMDVTITTFAETQDLSNTSPDTTVATKVKTMGQALALPPSSHWTFPHLYNYAVRIRIIMEHKGTANPDKMPAEAEIGIIPHNRYSQVLETLCAEGCDRDTVIAEYNITGTGHPREDRYKYKYAVDVDGTMFSRRFLSLLRSGSLVFKVKSTLFKEYFNNWLQPFEHYIPVLPDLLDLVQKVEWVNANPDKAQLIQKKGLEVAQCVLMDDQNDRWLSGRSCRTTHSSLHQLSTCD